MKAKSKFCPSFALSPNTSYTARACTLAQIYSAVAPQTAQSPETLDEISTNYHLKIRYWIEEISHAK